MLRPFQRAVVLLSVPPPAWLAPASLTGLPSVLNDRAELVTAYLLAPCPPPAGFPGNRWAHLMSIPSIYGSLLLPQVAEIMAVSCLSSAAHRRVSLKDLASDTKVPPSLKPLTSLLLTLGSLFGLKAGQVQGLQVCRVQRSNYPPYRTDVRYYTNIRVLILNIRGYSKLKIFCIH